MAKSIFFFEEDITFSLKNKRAIKSWLLQIIQMEKYDLQSINFILCSDDYLLNLNVEFLKHNTYTDIITFQYNNKEEPIFADIYISIDRCKENASINSVPVLAEFYRLLAHGVLHLCGYKDKKPSDKALMTSKEDYYLSLQTF